MNDITISRDTKDEIKDIVAEKKGEFRTSHVGAGIDFHRNGGHSSVVNIKDQCVYAQDALELAYFFKKLAKHLGA